MDAADKVRLAGLVLLALFCALGWAFNRTLDRQLREWGRQTEQIRQLLDSPVAAVPGDDPLHVAGHKPAQLAAHYLAEQHLDLGLAHVGILDDRRFWVVRCSCGAEFQDADGPTAARRRQAHAEAALAGASVAVVDPLRPAPADRGGVGERPDVPRPAISPDEQGGVA